MISATRYGIIVLNAMFSMPMGHSIWVPTSRVSHFKLGHVLCVVPTTDTFANGEVSCYSCLAETISQGYVSEAQRWLGTLSTSVCAILYHFRRSPIVIHGLRRKDAGYPGELLHTQPCHESEGGENCHIRDANASHIQGLYHEEEALPSDLARLDVTLCGHYIISQPICDKIRVNCALYNKSMIFGGKHVENITLKYSYTGPSQISLLTALAAIYQDGRGIRISLTSYYITYPHRTVILV